MRSSRRTRRRVCRFLAAKARQKTSRGEHTTRTGSFGGGSRRERPFERPRTRRARPSPPPTGARPAHAHRRRSARGCHRVLRGTCSCSARSANSAAPFEFRLLLASLPAWIAVASLNDLYRPDTERTHHPTTERPHARSSSSSRFRSMFWLRRFSPSHGNDADRPIRDMSKTIAFWVLPSGWSPSGGGSRGRCAGAARATCRTRSSSAPATSASCRAQAPAAPRVRASTSSASSTRSRRPRRASSSDLDVLGAPDELAELVALLDVERVIVAFSNDDARARRWSSSRSLRDLDVQVDIVPRLFELVGPHAEIHTHRGRCRSSACRRRARAARRGASSASIDVVVASSLLVARRRRSSRTPRWRIKRDSPGPVFFRQTRLGHEHARVHRAEVPHDAGRHVDRRRTASTSSRRWTRDAAPKANGLYKLERPDAVTPFGRWLRRRASTSCRS